MSKNSQISDFSMIAFSVLILVLVAFLIYTVFQKIRQRPLRHRAGGQHRQERRRRNGPPQDRNPGSQRRTHSPRTRFGIGRPARKASMSSR